MELRLELKLTQKLVMTPQLQQAIKLLQLSRLELRVKCARRKRAAERRTDQSLERLGGLRLRQ